MVPQAMQVMTACSAALGADQASRPNHGEPAVRGQLPGARQKIYSRISQQPEQSPRALKQHRTKGEFMLQGTGACHSRASVSCGAPGIVSHRQALCCTA